MFPKEIIEIFQKYQDNNESTLQIPFCRSWYPPDHRPACIIVLFPRGSRHIIPSNRRIVWYVLSRAVVITTVHSPVRFSGHFAQVTDHVYCGNDVQLRLYTSVNSWAQTSDVAASSRYSSISRCVASATSLPVSARNCFSS